MLITALLATAATHTASPAETLASNAAIPAAAVIEISCTQADISLAGRRVETDAAAVDAQSRFNVGSNAKSMLATLAAILIEEGLLSWTDTVAQSEAFSGLDIHPDLQTATLAELLSHTSGVAAFSSGEALNTVRVEGDAQAQRAQFAALALERAPEGERGAYLYSNAGYVIAGEMIAAVAGASLFDAMGERLFAPLDMEAHLGEPHAIGPGQPRGHTASDSGPQPLAADQEAIPDFLDAAGDISLTPAGYARYLQAHLCGLQGAEGIVSPAGFQRLHEAAPGTDYALGWARADLPAGRASFHIGGTGAFTTIAALVPATGAGAAVMMNAGGDDARSAGVAMVLELLAPAD